MNLAVDFIEDPCYYIVKENENQRRKEYKMTNENLVEISNFNEVKKIKKETKFVLFVTSFLVFGILLNLILVTVLPKNTIDTLSIVDLAVYLAVGGLIGFLLFLRKRKSDK